MEEIELKFRIKEPEAIKQKLEGVGAKYEGKVQQRDLWWIDRERKILGKGIRGLRLRGHNGKAVLTLKDEQVYGKVRKTKELEVNVSDFGVAFEILKRLGFKIDEEIKKEREVWRLGNLEIALDTVKDLGIFLELEGPEEENETAILKLGLEKEPRIVEHYGQLVEKQTKK